MRAIQNKVIVKINKELQKYKRERIGSLYIPDHLMDFQNNLQFGEVISFGPDVLKLCPDIEVGSVAIFIHTVEYKVENHNKSEDTEYKEDGDTHFLESEENGDEIRHLEVSNDIGSELFGIYKNGEIYPCKNIVFCYPQVVRSGFQLVNGLYINNDDDSKNMKDQIEIASEAMKMYGQQLSQLPERDETFHMRENIKKEITNLENHRNKLQKALNRIILAELKVAYVADNDLIKEGDIILHNIKHLYPLTLIHMDGKDKGKQFAIIRDVNLIHGKSVDGKPVPINDRVLIKQDEAKKVTRMGIVIPDTVNNKPLTGKVISIGNQSDQYEVDLKSGDKINFYPTGMIEIYIDNEPYLIIHSQNIFARTKRLTFTKNKKYVAV